MAVAELAERQVFFSKTRRKSCCRIQRVRRVYIDLPIYSRRTWREAVAIEADVRNEEDVNRAVQMTIDQWGTIDILVNNAGVMLLKSFDETTVEEWILYRMSMFAVHIYLQKPLYLI